MHAPFPGFGPEAPGWFDGLEKDNTKACFDRSRALWESRVRDPLERFLEAFAENPGGSVKAYRRNRDMRFSKNRAPYKTDTCGVVSVSGGESGLCVSISSKGLGAGSGYWRMAKDQLQRYREAVPGPEGAALEAAMTRMETSGVRLRGDALKSAPRGVPRDHPRIRLPRQENVPAGDDPDPKAMLDGRAPVASARSRLDRSRPVMVWMDAHVGPSVIPSEARFGPPA